jgi:hypothetical protein
MVELKRIQLKLFDISIRLSLMPLLESHCMTASTVSLDGENVSAIYVISMSTISQPLLVPALASNALRNLGC